MTIFIFGEAMLEYHSGGSGAGLRYGGDTLNTAIHLARLGHDVAYVTAVGDDPISDALVTSWADEGIDTRYVLRHPTRSPGIYAIHVDTAGERSFLYWRERSAARDMFSLPGMAEVLKAARSADLIYFSLISLAILPPDGRDQLLALAAKVREAGGRVAYDSNFRINLFDKLTEAQTLSSRAMACATIGMPTNVDEAQLCDQPMMETDIATRWLESGCVEVCVKAGERGCFFAATDQASFHATADHVTPVDTSGAGDAFNAGYLSKRLAGESAQAASQAGQLLARWVIGHTGAIPPRAETTASS